MPLGSVAGEEIVGTGTALIAILNAFSAV